MGRLSIRGILHDRDVNTLVGSERILVMSSANVDSEGVAIGVEFEEASLANCFC